MSSTWNKFYGWVKRITIIKQKQTKNNSFHSLAHKQFKSLFWHQNSFVVEAVANSDNYAVNFVIHAWYSLNKYPYTFSLVCWNNNTLKKGEG